MGQCWATAVERCDQYWTGVVYRCEEYCSCCRASSGHNRYTEFAPSSKGKYTDEKLLDQLHGRTELDGDVTQLGGRTYAFQEEEEDADMQLDGHATSRGRQRVASMDPSESVINAGAVEYHSVSEPQVSLSEVAKREEEDDDKAEDSHVRDVLMNKPESPPVAPSFEESHETTVMMETT